MKDLINAKLFLKNNMPWCTAYIVVTLVNITETKPLFFRKMSAPENHGFLGKIP